MWFPRKEKKRHQPSQQYRQWKKSHSDSHGVVCLPGLRSREKSVLVILGYQFLLLSFICFLSLFSPPSISLILTTSSLDKIPSSSPHPLLLHLNLSFSLSLSVFLQNKWQKARLGVRKTRPKTWMREERRTWAWRLLKHPNYEDKRDESRDKRQEKSEDLDEGGGGRRKTRRKDYL